MFSSLALSLACSLDAFRLVMMGTYCVVFLLWGSPSWLEGVPEQVVTSCCMEYQQSLPAPAPGWGSCRDPIQAQLHLLLLQSISVNGEIVRGARGHDRLDTIERVLLSLIVPFFIASE